MSPGHRSHEGTSPQTFLCRRGVNRPPKAIGRKRGGAEEKPLSDHPGHSPCHGGGTPGGVASGCQKQQWVEPGWAPGRTRGKKWGTHCTRGPGLSWDLLLQKCQPLGRVFLEGKVHLTVRSPCVFHFWARSRTGAPLSSAPCAALIGGQWTPGGAATHPPSSGGQSPGPPPGQHLPLPQAGQMGRRAGSRCAHHSPHAQLGPSRSGRAFAQSG